MLNYPQVRKITSNILTKKYLKKFYKTIDK